MTKESDCGCAGIFNAPFALESYLTVFEEEGALNRFETFASLNGPRFYGLPLNEDEVTLERAEVVVPGEVDGGDARVVPVPCRGKARLADGLIVSGRATRAARALATRSQTKMAAAAQMQPKHAIWA